MSKPRELTVDEVREKFLDHVRVMIHYWSHLNEVHRDLTGQPPTLEWCVSGVAFSILAAIDGSSMAIPGFVLAPSPHPTDKDFHRANGENWWPAAPDVPCDIAGTLHEQLQYETWVEKQKRLEAKK